LNGNANNAPLNYAAGLDLRQYEEVLAVLGQKGDLRRWYRDQSYCIEIRETPRSRRESYPSASVKWRLTDPCSELDYAYSRSLAPQLIPGVSTYKRGKETGALAAAGANVPDLNDIKKASEAGNFVLFCIDQAYKDKHVEEALASLGRVYYINRLEDLVSLVVDVTGRAYCGESFISSQ
jgi:hypothetical protein